MKNIYKIMSFLILSALTYTSCTPDEFELGDIDVNSNDLVEGISYTIKHDAENPNIVYLTSLMDSKYQTLWNHPQGRSQEKMVTLNMPFAGEYEVEFGVQTRGGYVYGEKATFEVDEIYPPFIQDPLWSIVAGGIGKSRTWYLDFDSEETSLFFGAPMWFFHNSYEWDNLHDADGGNYIDTNGWNEDKAIAPNLNSEKWTWLPNWKGNEWMCAAADFGTMTFDLIDGANVVVDQSGYSSSIAGGNVQEGKYMLDADNHTVKFTDAYPLHAIERTEEVTAATEFRILYADSAKMQIMVFPSGTCFNYISKGYRDNWTPGEVVEPEPTLPDGWADDVSVTKSSTIKWVLSPETPFNWANLDGSLKNPGWVSPETYADWTGFDATTPATYQGFSLSMNSETMEVEYVAPDGATENGTYTLDEKGIYTFNGVTPNFTIGSWMPFKTSEVHNITIGDEPVTTEANTFRITAIEKDLSGSVTGMWVGVREVDTEKGEYKNQYIVYKLIPQIGGGGGASGGEPQGTEIAFDNSKFLFGDIESNGNLRLELYNDYGNTASDSPFNRDDLVVNSHIEVTFTLGGVTLTDGAIGSYNTAFSLSDGDTNPQYWGDGTQEEVAAVTGDGTYTVSYDPSSTSKGAAVFVIDIKGMAAEITDLTAVTATIDKIVVY